MAAGAGLTGGGSTSGRATVQQRREDAFRDEVSRRGLTRYFDSIAEAASRRADANASGPAEAPTITATERMAALRRRVARRIEARASSTAPTADVADNIDTEAKDHVGDHRAAEPETGSPAPGARDGRRNELPKMHQNGMRIHQAPAQWDRSLAMGTAADGCNESALERGTGSHLREAAGMTTAADPLVESAATAAASLVAWHTGIGAADGA